MMTIRSASRALLSFGVLAVLSLAAASQSSGTGWSMTRLDVDVYVTPETGHLGMEGVVQLCLDAHASSSGPNLLINWVRTKDRDRVLRFKEVESDGADVRLRQESSNRMSQRAEVRFDKRKKRGDEISVRFIAESKGFGSQFLVHEDFAIASWTSGWIPFTNPSAGGSIRFRSGLLHVPGRTTLHLPSNWIGIVDGQLVERTRTESETIEEWNTPEGVSRSFAAGPFTAVTERLDGREISVYMSSKDKAISPKRLAELVAASMAAQEEKLGPFPFPSYSVVETPSMLPGQDWGAASQQTFIIARSSCFDHEHGNLALWGHEMAHGWWGNTVGTKGPGSLWCGESLAQVGALVSLESLEGPESLRDYLAFSRSGSSPVQCASGYFLILRGEEDAALSTMGQAGAAHELADSKGVWVHHMLRRYVGDDVYFGVLRGIIADFAHEQVSIEDFRRRFIAAAPDLDLKTFFAQWLDRTGAPILDVDWYSRPDHRALVLHLKQAQKGKPFVFDLDVEVQLASGKTVVETVEIREESHTFVLDTQERPAGVRLDPELKLLIWRPEYGPRPGDDYAAGPAPPTDVVAAVVGTYRLREREQDFDVFKKDGQLFIQARGQPAVAMRYREGGTFDLEVPGERMVAEFDLSKSPSPLFRATESEKEYFADRVSD